MSVLLIHDTTLRDGEQGIGNTMSLFTKQAVLEQLDLLPLDFIELGFPASSDEDFNWIKSAARMPLRATPVVLLRPTLHDIRKTLKATEEFESIQYLMLGTGSELHQERKRRRSLGDLLHEIEDAITCLRTAGRENVAVILEDASRGSPAYIQNVSVALSGLGVRSVTLADTVGASTPGEIGALFSTVTSNGPPQVSWGVHCHDDLGLATANTLAAVVAGAQLAHVTVGGLGERAGNCPLEEIVAVLHYKDTLPGFAGRFDLKTLHDVAERIFALLGKPIPPSKPILGQHVFSTAAGIHQNGLLKDPDVYEYVKPGDFGRERRLIVNRLSGRSIVTSALPDVSDGVVDRFCSWLFELERDIDAIEISGYFDRFVKENVSGSDLQRTALRAEHS
ncbi:LeuA family protein [Caballeronia sp. LZ034LL]|uniref:LeuA family protein n=1 Tax=Caballeronia sp. LZ034LL TaxID=3038567 RepID=UPI002866AFB5|nr:LeuA family protein [Caballeronia sp. LZ034LL]MDR5836655.1 LeuA family protein [Caballeronia sp. LZ034LL]